MKFFKKPIKNFITIIVCTAIINSLFIGFNVYATYISETSIFDKNSLNQASIDSQGFINTVYHSHPDTTQIHFHVDGLTAGTYRYIMIDKSNIGTADNNYKHINTDYIHAEWLQVQVDSDNVGDYLVSIGFLEDVNATDGDRYLVKHWNGTKTAGNQLGPLFENLAPDGWKMQRESISTHAISLNDANWSNTDTYGDTLNPAGSVNPGIGDVVLEIVVNAGEINVAFDMSYHSH